MKYTITAEGLTRDMKPTEGQQAVSEVAAEFLTKAANASPKEYAELMTGLDRGITEASDSMSANLFTGLKRLCADVYSFTHKEAEQCR